MSYFTATLRRIFLPTYDELHLFVFSFTLILFFIVKFPSMLGAGNFIPETNGAGPVILSIVLITGVCLSIYHAFSKGKIGHYEKLVLFLFASFINGFSGIWVGTYLLSMSAQWSWVLVFPIMNILSSFIILSEVRYRVEEGEVDECIEDKNVRLSEVAVSVLIVGIVFLITYYYLKIHEMTIFSICVAYGTNLNRVIVNLLVPEKCYTKLSK